MSHITYFPYKRLTPQEKAFYEKRLGRELTAKEELMGQLSRKPNPQFGEPWRLRPIGPQESPLDRQLREAKQAVEDERVANLTDAGRRLHAMEKAVEDRNAKAAAQVAHVAKLQHFKRHLEHLDQLMEAARFDESYTYEDVAELWNTKQQIESEQGCPVHAAEMFDYCLVKAKAKIEARRQDALAAKDSLLAEQMRQESAIADFQEQWGFLAPSPEAANTSEKENAYRVEIAALQAVVDEKRKAVDVAKPNGRVEAILEYSAACSAFHARFEAHHGLSKPGAPTTTPPSTEAA